MNKVDEMCRIFGCRRSDLMEEHYLPSSAYATLRSDEQQLLTRYNQLNTYGKEKTLEYIDDLVVNEKYTEERSLDSKGTG